MKKLRVAVVGCGNISVMHLDSAKALDEAELVAVCDIKEERAKTAAEKYGTAYHTDDGVRLEFDEPVRAITPGQSLVIYDGNLVLGGGEIV